MGGDNVDGNEAVHGTGKRRTKVKNAVGGGEMEFAGNAVLDDADFGGGIGVAHVVLFLVYKRVIHQSENMTSVICIICIFLSHSRIAQFFGVPHIGVGVNIHGGSA